MPDLLNYQPSNSAVYYTPRKRIDLFRTLVGFVVASLVAVFGAVLYAKIQPTLQNMYIRFGASLVAACAVGLCGAWLVHYGKIRIPIVAASLGALLALLVIYGMWITWVHDVVLRFGGKIHYFFLISHPRALVQIIRLLNRSGTWTLKGDVVNGPGLLIFWLVEAAFILAAGVLMPVYRQPTDDPVCLECGSRCLKAPTRPRFAADREGDFVAAIEGRQFASISSFSAPLHEDDPELSIRLMSCPRCKKTHVLTVSRVAWHIGKNQRPKVKINPLVNQLLVTPEEAALIQITCKNVLESRKIELERS